MHHRTLTALSILAAILTGIAIFRDANALTIGAGFVVTLGLALLALLGAERNLNQILNETDVEPEQADDSTGETR